MRQRQDKLAPPLAQVARRPRSCDSALERVVHLANQLSKGPANARQLVRELFVAFTNVMREEHWKPQPIASAPKEPERALLLYCPEQGGWHTGEWRQGEWTDALTRAKHLKPTHWTDVPPRPEESETQP